MRDIEQAGAGSSFSFLTTDDLRPNDTISMCRVSDGVQRSLA